MAVAVRIGNGRDVADIVAAGGVLQHDIAEIDLAEDVIAAGTGKVSFGLEGDLGRAALVDVEGVQVRIANMGVELVGGVPVAG